MQTTSEPEATRTVGEEEPYPSPNYAWYVVGVLTLVYVFSFIDRQILALLVRPIRRDLNISDTQMSLLMGSSFAVFYTFFGIPLGRLADSRSRRTIIAVGFVAWSAFTAGCGLARNYAQMLLLRMGVGVGEAALSPAAYSLITDYFPRNRLATAISVYSMGIYIGSGLALVLGGTITGLIGEHDTWEIPIIGPAKSWQITFFIVGLPGILLALLMYTIKEPVRRGVKRVTKATGKIQAVQVPLREVYVYILENRTTFLCHNLGFALISLSNYGATQWIPAFFQRTHGWPTSTAGIVYGFIVGIFGTLGIVAGGRMSDWLAERGYRDAPLRVGLLVSLMWFPPGMLYSIVPNSYWAAALLAPAVFMTSAPFGVAAAAVQQMMPNNMRGQASAIYLFIVNLIGLGLGPTAVAATTEFVLRDENALRYSLLIVATTAHLIAALLLWAGLKPFVRSLDRLKEWNATST